MMMKKLSEEHYIIVDDSEIKEGDWVVSGTKTIVQCMYPENVHHEDIKKVTHSTQPLDKSLFFTDRVWGCERLSIGEVKELLGVVDVEKKANEYFTETNPYHPEYNEGLHIGYKVGYNQAIEDNKEKKYTDTDLFKILLDFIEFQHPHHEPRGSIIERFIKTRQPKTEWEVEIVDGKLKLKQ